MTAVQHQATLHEKAVQKVAKDGVDLPKRTRAKATKKVLPARHNRDIPIEPKIWAQALKAAGGDLSKIVIHAPLGAPLDK